MRIRTLQRHYTYLKIAEQISKLSHCVRKQVGAVLVKDDMLISDGYNGTPKSMDNCCEDDKGETNWFTLHAEANCIFKIAKSTLSSEGSILYLTLSPCKDCSKLILQAGIKEIYYLVEHSCKAGLEFLESNGIKCNELQIQESIQNNNLYERYRLVKGYTGKLKAPEYKDEFWCDWILVKELPKVEQPKINEENLHEYVKSYFINNNMDYNIKSTPKHENMVTRNIITNKIIVKQI